MASREPEFNPIAAFVSWLLPGAGHVFILKERRRGFLIMGGILFLVIAGLLIGGVNCVDHREARLWFYAQALNGPIALLADWLNQSWIKGLPPEQLLYSRGLGRPNELGTLFVALAGLMNLVVMLDALHHIPREIPREHGSTGEQGRATSVAASPQRRSSDAPTSAPGGEGGAA